MQVWSRHCRRSGPAGQHCGHRLPPSGSRDRRVDRVGPWPCLAPLHGNAVQPPRPDRCQQLPGEGQARRGVGRAGSRQAGGAAGAGRGSGGGGGGRAGGLRGGGAGGRGPGRSAAGQGRGRSGSPPPPPGSPCLRCCSLHTHLTAWCNTCLFALEWTIVTMFSTHVTTYHHLISQAGWNRCNLSAIPTAFLCAHETLSMAE